MSRFEDHCWQDVIEPEVLKIYQAYERETFIGKNPVVLLVDLYNLVYQGGRSPVHELVQKHPSTCGEYAWDAIEPTKQLISLARSKHIPLIYSTRGTDQVHPTLRNKNVIL